LQLTTPNQTVSLVAFEPVALGQAGKSAGNKQPLDMAKLVGKWQSVNLDGKDIGSFIVAIEVEFGPKRRVTMIAQVDMDGEAQSSTKMGTYKVASGKLQMTFDNETRLSKAWFQNGRLVIQDPKLDSRAHYKRINRDK
jgi:hypothetical protein